jgi:tetratricopeptide (TPR) repeat protein
MFVSPAGVVALVAVLGAGATGCGQIGMLKGKMAFKEANQLYAAQNYAAAAEKYEEALEAGCSTGECQPAELAYSYFFLANSYDNMFRPARKGDPDNDAYLQKAVENYRKAAELSPDDQYRLRALQYMVPVHGPDKLDAPEEAERLVQRLIEMDPDDPLYYFQLSRLYEDSGDFPRAEEQLLRAREIRPNDPDVYNQLARYYEARGEFDKQMEALHTRASKQPENPEAQYVIATTYWNKACLPSRPQCAPIAAPTDALKAKYIASGLEAADAALSLRGDYVDALVYKNLLLRSQTYLEKSKARQDALLAEAEQLLQQVQEIQKRRSEGGAGAASL